MLRFITTLFLNAVLVLAVNGQNYVSLSDKTGFWTSESTWEKGIVPGTRSAGTVILNNLTIGIHGTVKSLDNISANESYIVITAGDTLVIVGNLTLSPSSSVVNNGVLVVFGNVINMDSKMLVSGAGKMVVTGNYTSTGSSDNSINGPTYVFDSSNIIPTPPKDSDLRTRDINLYNFVHGMQKVLPIELAYFQASLQYNRVQLKWETISEINNDYFLVERSSDGIHFELVQKVVGAGNSKITLQYEIYDPNPLSGKSYYKLSQVDFDGKSATFKIVSVNSDREAVLQVYPNPTADFLYFNCSVCNYSVALRDANGRLQLEGIVVSEIEQGKFGIDLTPLEPGVYFVMVKVSDTGSPSTFRIVKR